MAKRPAPGKTKTRLSTALSPQQAASLYACFLGDTLSLMRQASQAVADVQPAIAYAPATEKAYFTTLAPDFELLLQKGNNLSERLAHISNYCFSQGYTRVVLMDSDSPTLPLDYLTTAFRALNDKANVVLGPCDDGGYYLIGLNQPAPRLFLDVTMSTPTVAADTLAIAQSEGLQTDLLPTWYDVDDAASLQRLRQDVVNLDETQAVKTREFLNQLDS
ncbi:MAG: TIGR04282 family arsenosugar biosynthesis glycosyltransferase [Chloroflexota bacterium]